MPGVGQSGEVKRALNAHSGWVNAVAWSHCGKWLASGGDDKMVYIYDAQTLEVKCPVNVDSIVWSVAFSPCGKTMAVGCYNGTVVIVDVATVAVMRSLSGHSDW
jgi:WD40 repeat protein